MSKKRQKKIQRVPTKGQLSYWQRQKRLQRISVFSAFSLIFLTLALLGFGYYDLRIKPQYQSALRVNDRVFNMSYYARMLRLQGGGQDAYKLMQMTEQVTSLIQTYELLRQSAPKMGVSVTPEEVDRSIRERLRSSKEEKLGEAEFQRRYEDTLRRLKISEKEYRELVAAELLRDKLREKVVGDVPSVAPQVHVQVALLAEEDEALKARARMEKGEDFVTIVKELSRDPNSLVRLGELGWLPKGVMSQEFDQAVFKLSVDELSQPVWDPEAMKAGGYWVLEVTEKNIGFVKLRGILLSSRAQADDVKARLEKGEDFAALARELSQDESSKGKGGDLGQVNQGTRSKIFEDMAFNILPGEISPPFIDDSKTTKGGFWLIKVLEKEEARAVDKDMIELITSKEFNRWFVKEKESSRLESYLNDDKVAWAVAQASALP